jgi:hypothetical protein
LQHIDSTSLEVDKTIKSSTLVKLDPNLVIGNNDISLTLRYKHAPIYHIVEMRRQTIQTFKFELGEEKLQNLPVSGLGRRAHYMLTPISLNGDTLLNNNFTEI